VIKKNETPFKLWRRGGGLRKGYCASTAKPIKGRVEYVLLLITHEGREKKVKKDISARG